MVGSGLPMQPLLEHTFGHDKGSLITGVMALPAVVAGIMGYSHVANRLFYSLARTGR